MGWQRQDHGPVGPADARGSACRDDRRAGDVHAAGRTDAGVHALAMSAHVDVDEVADRAPAARGAERAGPARIRSRSSRSSRSPTTGTRVSPASGGAISTGSSTAARRRRSTRGRVWHIAVPLDVEAMREGAAHLVGRHDFTTFRSAHCQSDSPVKTLDALDVEPRRRGDPHRRRRRAASSTTRCGRWSAAWRWSAAASGSRTTWARRSTPATAPRSASMPRPHGLYFVESHLSPDCCTCDFALQH